MVDMTFANPSLTSIPEAELVDMLLRGPLTRADLLGINGIPSGALTATRLPLEVLPGNPRGDVDLLAWEAENPAEATAYEMKRFKVIVEADLWGQINKLQEFQDASRQASLLASIGFRQVYLWLFVVVDSRKRNVGKISFDGLTAEHQATIDEAIDPRQLDSRVGLVVHELVQPMDHAPLSVGAGHLHLIRLAGPRAQPAAVTMWVSSQQGKGAA